MAESESERNGLMYLKHHWPEFIWSKTGGEGWLDYVGEPEDEEFDLPRVACDIKIDTNRAEESQKLWVASPIGLRHRCYILWGATPEGPWHLYSWDDWMLYVEDEGLIAQYERQEKERKERAPRILQGNKLRALVESLGGQPTVESVKDVLVSSGECPDRVAASTRVSRLVTYGYVDRHDDTELATLTITNHDRETLLALAREVNKNQKRGKKS